MLKVSVSEAPWHLLHGRDGNSPSRGLLASYGLLSEGQHKPWWVALIWSKPFLQVGAWEMTWAHTVLPPWLVELWASGMLEPPSGASRSSHVDVRSRLAAWPTRGFPCPRGLLCVKGPGRGPHAGASDMILGGGHLSDFSFCGGCWRFLKKLIIHFSFAHN